MKSSKKQAGREKVPFFARFLIQQELKTASGHGVAYTLKYPSDGDEYDVTLKYPSDGDEDTI
jgi:hypothetical protein